MPEETIPKGPSAAPSFPTRQPCRFFQNGDCRYGEKCRFLHSIIVNIPRSEKPPSSPGQLLRDQRGQDGRASPEGQSTSLNEPPSTPQPISEQSESRAPKPTVLATTVPTTVVVAPVSTSSRHVANVVNGAQQHQSLAPTKPCFAWRAGNCRFGDRCRYSHQIQNPNQQRIHTTERSEHNVPGTAPNGMRPHTMIATPVLLRQEGEQEGHFRGGENQSRGRRGRALRGGKAVAAGRPQKQAEEARQREERARQECEGAQRVEQAARKARLDLEAERRVQAAREEAERKAREEREEAERKLREEQEEAARKAREEQAEAARKAREEAARKAREEAARKAREEAARKAREEAARKARQEAARKARQEAARKAREEREEAARKEREAQEEAARKEREEREEAERKAREAREEAERKEREEREEAARKAREEREEAQRRAREEREEAQRRARQAQLEERRAQEARVTVQQVVLGSSLVTCGAGIDIRGIVGGFDLCRILVKHLPRNARPDEVVGIFSQQGVDPENFFLVEMKPNGGHTEATVLAKAEQGEVIALGLDGVEFRDQRLQFEVSANASWDSMGSSGDNSNTLTINWNVPSTSMIATYTTLDLARVMAKELDGQICSGRKVRAVMNRPPTTASALRHYNPASVKLMNLPPNVASIDVEIFSGTQTLRAIASLTYNLQEFIEFLRNHLERLPGVVHQSFFSIPSNERDHNSRVKVRFDTWEAAKSASDALDNAKLRHDYPFLRTSLPRAIQYVINIPRVQYQCQRKLWDSLVEGREKGMAGVQVQERPDGRVIIKVMGDDKKAVGALKVRVENLVSGERLDASYWHRSFFSTAGQQFLQQVRTASGAYVRTDRKIQALRIYGNSEMVDEAKELIEEEVERLSFLEWVIPLKRQSVRFFVRRGLAALKEVLGEENVSLDLASTPCKLTIRGGDEARHHLSRLIDESLTDFGLDQDHAADGDDLCPICYDTVSHPESLGCGHTYCTACLRHYLTSAPDTKKFPLVCMGNEATCNIPISIPIIKKFLTEQRFNHLIEVAFLSYLEKHPQEFKYCTTPDCSQIYQSNSTKTMLQCPACFSTICPSCHEESHEGMTCEERKIHSNPAEQERLTNEWAAMNGVKKCPSCSVWLEKTEGCNHMSCKCGAHICWRCMGVFTAGTIYDHMQTAHGGIYDAAPQRANQPERNNVQAPVADNLFVAAQRAEFQRIERERQAAARRELMWAGIDWEAEGVQRTPAQRAREEAENRERETQQRAANLRARAREFEEIRLREERIREAREERTRVLIRRMELERHMQEREALEAQKKREGGGFGCIIM